MSIADNVKSIAERIEKAALKVGRASDSVRLVAVSKTQSAVVVDEAARTGQMLYGENYVQEFLAKRQDVREPVTWHFIGALQSNKVRQVAGLVDLIHSVDRLSLAQEIERQWSIVDKVCHVLLQVNIAGESTKSGSSAEGVVALAKQVAKLPHVKIDGLMTMPPFFDDPESARPYFKELAQLSRFVAAEGIPNVSMSELSMGMSGDFEVAIEEGATLVRIGSAIFGERKIRHR